MKYSKIISWSLFLVLAGLGVWGVAHSIIDRRDVTPTLAAGSFLQLDYIQEEPAIKAELVQAQKSAKRWNAAAELVAISMRFDDGLNYDVLQRYAYVFQAPGMTNDYVVNNSRSIKQGQTYTPADIFGEIKPSIIDEEYLKINFVQALEITERAGGGDFRMSHSGNYSVSLLLIQPQNDVLSWVVAYQDKSGASSQIWRVNAATGSIQQQ